VVPCVDERKFISCAVGKRVFVAGASSVENVRDGSERLVFVGAANVFVSLDISKICVSLLS
jgi:hypothetical protein